MRDARDGAVRFLVERVEREIILHELLRVRNALQPNWVAGISDEAEVIRVDADVKQRVEFFREFFVEIEPFDKIFAAVNARPQHFLP